MRQNKLNELDAKSWLKFTKTWFIHNPKARGEKEKLHPAKYPESLIKEFILFFTKPGEFVLDPFLGTGSTLVAAHDTGRNGIGIELQDKYAEIAMNRIKILEAQQSMNACTITNTKQKVIVGSSLEIDKLITEQVDFVITSPPYGPMLNKKGLAQKVRVENDLDTKYSENAEDIGNIINYDKFVETLSGIFKKVKTILKDGKYIVIIIQNYRDGGVYRTLAWDTAKVISEDFTLVGERIWCQDNKTLFPYGMGYSFVPNVHHHYCLLLRKITKS